MKKFQQASILAHIWNYIANYKAIVLQKLSIDFEQIGSLAQKCYYLKSSKVYIISIPDGTRGEPDDPLLDMRTPTLFVIGDNATQTRPDDLEDIRERMRAETSMVVIGGADDKLRMSKHKKTAEGITQSMVDRCIADEIYNFISYVLNAPPPTAFAIPSAIPGTPQVKFFIYLYIKITVIT